MQHTDKYKLNLIEKDDPFSPDPLNENAQKLEAALDTKADLTETGQCFSSLAGQISALASGKTDAAETAALSARISAVEAHHAVMGYYIGGGSDGRTIELGFTPASVLIMINTSSTYTYLYLLERGVSPAENGVDGEIIDGGFHVGKKISGILNGKYIYIAIA